MAVATAFFAALATVVVSVLPFLHFAYRGPRIHLAIETTAALAALLAAYLVFGRVRRTARLNDLGIACALTLLAGANLLFSVLPSAVDASPGRFATWAPVAGGLLGAGILAVSSLSSPRTLRLPRTAIVRTSALCLAALGVIALAVALVGAQLPRGIDPALSPDASGRPRIVGDPAVLTVQLAAMALFALAAVGFTRRAEREHDELLTWLAAGATLAAFARLNYFLFPSLYSNWVYTGDILRLGFYLVLLAGAAREIRAYWRRLAASAVADERRRMARDLHDGLAQELAYIVAQTRRLSRGEPTPQLESLGAAAERALNESRRAIEAFAQLPPERLDLALAKTAAEIADRAGTTLELRLIEVDDVGAAKRDALLKIAREAVANAARHGAPKTICVELSNKRGLRLRVRDDGAGFDPTHVHGNGHRFGLTSMKERAHALGGEFHIASVPGRGTEIEVLLP